jgi:hypothetical protein
MAKITYIKEPNLAFPVDYPAWVRLHTKDGRILEWKVLKVAGSAENPMLAEEYEKKFINNACRSIDAVKAARIINLMQSLLSLNDMAELAALYG